MSIESSQLIGVAVGNTRTMIGHVRGMEVGETSSHPSDDPAAVAKGVSDIVASTGPLPVVVASVNEPAARAIAKALSEDSGDRVFRLGADLPIPILHALDDDSTVGQDRLLNAMAAHRIAGQACVVVDAGTCVTVDFVDGEGTFHGGVIAPGLQMMLDAMHHGTASLPRIVLRDSPAPAGPFGKETRGAMLLGVREAVLGLVRLTLERYAEHYGAYPQVIATGGDALTLFEGDEIIESIVPNLQLAGIAAACLKGAEQESQGEPE